MSAGFGPIAGLKIGHAQDDRALTGCTVLLVVAQAYSLWLVFGAGRGTGKKPVLREHSL